MLDENGGYVENPKTVKLSLSTHTFLYIEFHPGDTLYYIGTDMIGCTGPDYLIREMELSQFFEYTKEMGDKEKLFLLPMLKVRGEEKESATELIMSILSMYPLQKCDTDKICDCILENCRKRDCGQKCE